MLDFSVLAAITLVAGALTSAGIARSGAGAGGKGELLSLAADSNAVLAVSVLFVGGVTLLSDRAGDSKAELAD